MKWFKTVLDMASNINDLTEKFKIKERTETLKRKMETLAAREADVRTQLDVEEKRPGKKRKEEANVWLKNSERLRDKIDGVVQNVTTSASHWKLILGSSLDKLIREAEQLHEQGRFSEGLTLDVEETRGYKVPVEKLVGQDFQSNVEKVWNYLMSEKVQPMGVQGMGGVGKTTLVKHIHNRIVNDPVTFEGSCWVTVSQDCSVRRLQDAIAKHLRLDLENENDEMIRAGRLCEELKMRMMTRKFVIILDDVWDYYPLEKVGIPFEKIGCKLILTSRKKDVCHQMKCSELVKVAILPEQEAWYLFRDNLGHGTLLSQDVENIAQAVARECAGLPLGIVVLSGIMRGVSDIYEWRSALEDLQESKFNTERMEDEVFTILRFSYQRLSDRVLQQCFLHITLYPEDEEISKLELIEYFIDSRLIERGRTMKAKFDKGFAILNKLINSCLLEEIKGFHKVKMHDLVRDMGINIANGLSMVKAGQQLREIPDGREWIESLEKVSLMNNYIKEISPSASPRCSKISTLFLQWNPLVSIPKSFFWHMQTLQFLNLSGTKIKELPNSFSELDNLTTLHLMSCKKLKSLPSVAKMVALKTLNLCKSGIEKIPQGMERLCSLIYLDLGYTKRLKGKQWPIGILPQLLLLQYLDFAFGPRIMNGEELVSLRKLEYLRCWFDNVDEFSTCMNYLQSKTPHVNSWDIALGDNKFPINASLVFSSNMIKIMKRNMGERGNSFQLPNGVNELYLQNCQGVASICQWGATFSELEKCEINYCNGMEMVIDDSQQCTPLFPKLRSLNLQRLRDLKAVISNSLHSSMTLGSGSFFSSLKHLNIWRCPRIKKLLTSPLLPITQLECILVRDCKELEEIFAFEDDDYTDSILDLPKLSKMVLDNLPQLKSVCRAKWTMKCDSLQSINIQRCPKLERIPENFRIPSDPCQEEDLVPTSLNVEE